MCVVYVCVCVCVCRGGVYAHICACVHLCGWVLVCVYRGLFIHLFVYMCLCTVCVWLVQCSALEHQSIEHTVAK